MKIDPDNSVDIDRPEPLSPELVDRLEKSLQRMLEWIRAIDTKTQLALGINLAMLGALVAVVPSPKSVTTAVLLLVAFGGVLPVIKLRSMREGVLSTNGRSRWLPLVLWFDFRAIN